MAPAPLNHNRVAALTEARQAEGEVVVGNTSAPARDIGSCMRRWLRQPPQGRCMDTPKPLLINGHTSLG
jgi:hypothetical protein